MPNPDKVRQQIIDDSSWLARDVPRRMMRLADSLYLVQQHVWWVGWKSHKTRKAFRTFDEWLSEEVSLSRSKSYRLLRMRKNLKQLSGEVLEQLDETKAYELSRLAQARPKLLLAAVKKVTSNGNMTTHEVREMVERSISGESLESQRLKLVGFLVPAEELAMVNRVFELMQFLQPIPKCDPSGEFCRGVHLVSLCQERMTDEDMLKAAEEFTEAEKAFVVEE